MKQGSDKIKEQKWVKVSKEKKKEKEKKEKGSSMPEDKVAIVVMNMREEATIVKGRREENQKRSKKSREDLTIQ